MLAAQRRSAHPRRARARRHRQGLRPRRAAGCVRHDRPPRPAGAASAGSAREGARRRDRGGRTLDGRARVRGQVRSPTAGEGGDRRAGRLAGATRLGDRRLGRHDDPRVRPTSGGHPGPHRGHQLGLGRRPAAPHRGDESISVLVTGGLRTPSDALVGPVAITALRSLHVDAVFLGVHGMEERAGFSTPNLLEAETNRAMIRSGRAASSCCADSSKWGVVGLSSMAGLSEAHVLITDTGLSAQASAILTDRVEQLVLVDPRRRAPDAPHAPARGPGRRMSPYPGPRPPLRAAASASCSADDDARLPSVAPLGRGARRPRRRGLADCGGATAGRLALVVRRHPHDRLVPDGPAATPGTPALTGHRVGGTADGRAQPRRVGRQRDDVTARVTCTSTDAGGRRCVAVQLALDESACSLHVRRVTNAADGDLHLGSGPRRAAGRRATPPSCST